MELLSLLSRRFRPIVVGPDSWEARSLQVSASPSYPGRTHRVVPPTRILVGAPVTLSKFAIHPAVRVQSAHSRGK